MPATKWIVYACGAVVLGLIALFSGNVRKTFFVVTVMALQANVALEIGSQSRSLYVGSSGPGGFMLPLIMLPAMVLLGWQFLAGSLEGQRFKWTFGSFTLPVAAFVLTTASTMIYGLEKWPVIYYLQVPIYGYLLCLVAANLIQSRADLARVLMLLLVVLAMQSLVYYVQNVTGVTFTLTGDVVSSNSAAGLQRHGGTVSTNPKSFAMFISCLTLLSLATFLSTANRQLRRVSSVLLVMGMFALVLTFTRAAWAGFLMGSVVVVGLGLRRGRIQLRRVLWVVGALVLAVAVLLPMVLIRLSANHEKDYEERAVLMRIAWRVIEANPLAGVGAGAYGLVMRGYLLPQERNKWLYVVHNAYLLRWAETGLFGFLSFLWVLVAGFRAAIRCTRSRDDATFAIGAGWCAGLLHLCWEQLWDLGLGGTTPFLFWFMLGVVQAALAIEKRETSGQKTSEQKAPRSGAFPLRPYGAVA